MTTLDDPWDDMHHHSFLLSQEEFQPHLNPPVCVIETKDLISSGHVDWFNNPIPTPDAFKKGNIANIYPTIKIYNSFKWSIIEEITLDITCTPEEIISYKSLFQEF